MKLTFGSLLLILAALCGCGDMGPHWKGLEGEDRLRSNLNHSWAYCRPLSKGSATYIFDFTGQNMKVDALVHESSDCTGSAKRFNLARYSYSNFKSEDGNRGTASVEQLTYFPNRIEAEEGVVRIGQKYIVSAQARFTVSSDAQQLVVTLSQIVLESPVEGLHENVESPVSDKSTVTFRFQRNR